MANGKNGSMQISIMVGIFGIVIAGGAAMVSPMNLRIDTLNGQHESHKKEMMAQIRDLKDELLRIDTRERSANESLATMNERFKEVETQFKLFQEVNATKFSAFERRLTQGEIDGNPRHDERIKNLEQTVNGKKSP